MTPAVDLAYPRAEFVKGGTVGGLFWLPVGALGVPAPAGRPCERVTRRRVGTLEGGAPYLGIRVVGRG